MLELQPSRTCAYFVKDFFTLAVEGLGLLYIISARAPFSVEDKLPDFSFAWLASEGQEGPFMDMSAVVMPQAHIRMRMGPMGFKCLGCVFS